MRTTRYAGPPPRQASLWSALGQSDPCDPRDHSPLGQTDLFLDHDVSQWAGLGWRGTEGVSDPALGIREGFLKEGASTLGLGAVCCGKRQWGVPERGNSICKGLEVRETVACFRHKCKRLSAVSNKPRDHMSLAGWQR